MTSGYDGGPPFESTAVAAGKYCHFQPLCHEHAGDVGGDRCLSGSPDRNVPDGYYRAGQFSCLQDAGSIQSCPHALDKGEHKRRGNQASQQQTAPGTQRCSTGRSSPVCGKR